MISTRESIIQLTLETCTQPSIRSSESLGLEPPLQSGWPATSSMHIHPLLRPTLLIYFPRNHKHVTLKIFARGCGDQDEFEVYERLGRGNHAHPGFGHVRTALDTFLLPHPRDGDQHHCLVQKPMWDSWKDLLLRNPARRFTEPLLKAGLQQLLLALDYLHTECQIVHTGEKMRHTVFPCSLFHFLLLSPGRVGNEGVFLICTTRKLIYGRSARNRHQSRQYPPRDS